MTLLCGLVQPGDLHKAWPDAEPLIATALERSYGELETEDLFMFIYEQKMQLWVVFDKKSKHLHAVAVTEHITTPRKSYLSVVITASDNTIDWESYIKVLEDYAIHFGLQEVRALCRPGFERTLAPLDYKKCYITLIKSLGGKYGKH